MSGGGGSTLLECLTNLFWFGHHSFEEFNVNDGTARNINKQIYESQSTLQLYSEMYIQHTALIAFLNTNMPTWHLFECISEIGNRWRKLLFIKNGVWRRDTAFALCISR